MGLLQSGARITVGNVSRVASVHERTQALFGSVEGNQLHLPEVDLAALGLETDRARENLRA